MPDDSVAGLTPDQWEERLDSVSDEPEKLAAALEQLEQEMRQEDTWVHDNPTPGPIFKAIFRFFSREDDRLEALGEKIHSELHAERRLKDRYRGWLPGEVPTDRLFSYLKDFGGEVHPDEEGVQFEGFLKYKGLHRGTTVDAFTFFLNDRFPGRDPANFHLSYLPAFGELVIKRVYKMELPRRKGKSAARAVLAEMVDEIVLDRSTIRSLVVDNAANIETRQAFLRVTRTEDDVKYEIRARVDPAKTPLGHLMLKMAARLGLKPGDFTSKVNQFGVLKISLPVKPA